MRSMKLLASIAPLMMATDPLAAGAPTDPAASLGAGGTPAAADPNAGQPAPAADPNMYTFRIPHTETDIGIDISQIPPEVRMDILKKGIYGYVVNSTNQLYLRNNKDNAPFDAYDEAVKADPLQTAVAKPAGERKTADLLASAAAARKRLYDGEVRKQSADGGTPRRAPVDPLTKLVTEAVVRELHEKDKAAGGKRKYTEFTAEVAKAGGGINYLKGKVDEKVNAQPADKQAEMRATLEKFMDERYIKPANMMLGAKTNKATDPANSIL